jgi:hypothetical protein
VKHQRAVEDAAEIILAYEPNALPESTKRASACSGYGESP